MSDKIAELEARVVAAERLAQRVNTSTSNPFQTAHLNTASQVWMVVNERSEPVCLRPRRRRERLQPVHAPPQRVHRRADQAPVGVQRHAGDPGPVHQRRVYTDYDSVMAYHTGRPAPAGKLILHQTTTPTIEVAEDGETAKGFWLMAGLESGVTEPENVGAMPECLYEPVEKNVQGKRVWAHWVWCQYALDFLKQDGEWKIWHFRCLEVSRAPFSENWITFAGKNQIAFEKDLAYFGNDGKAVFMPKPDEPATKHSETQKADIYGPNRVRKLDVPLPVPYKTFSETEEY
ncbi:hypothetical protein PG996_002892 [Apiospora saccharicola]|uniref:SnoaL-like domain-containing protein n=1 Tax=Apiospora saccharicola TaxID=335842 RepID=A0ABR1WNR0_9PEZI